MTGTVYTFLRFKVILLKILKIVLGKGQILNFTIFNLTDNKNLSISSARELLKQCKDNFKLPLNFNFEEFRIVANGVFQAEGHVSCRIRDNKVFPVFAINQNLSEESLNFFLTLWHVLGRTGTLSLTINRMDKLVIRLSSESWDTVLNTYAKFFDSTYGEKYIAFQKLADIHSLISKKLKLRKPNSPDCSPDLALQLAIHIVYDLSLDGTNRKLSLSEQLSLFGLNSNNVKLPIYKDNNTIPSIFFIIGFIIGDRTLHLRLRNSDKGSIWLIPTLLLPQLKNKYNAHFFSMLEKFFKSCNIKTYIINKTKETEILNIISADIYNSQFSPHMASARNSISPFFSGDKGGEGAASSLNRVGTAKKKKKKKKAEQKAEQKNMTPEMTILTVDSAKSIFVQFIPLIKPFSHYLYWKKEQYYLMSRVAHLINAKTHYTLYGFLNIIDIIYSYPNKRAQSKEYWVHIIKSWFNARAEKTLSGENNIQAVYGRGILKGKVIAWKCVFPVGSNIKSRQFSFTNSFESREALYRARLYRDVAIKSWVAGNSIK